MMAIMRLDTAAGRRRGLGGCWWFMTTVCRRYYIRSKIVTNEEQICIFSSFFSVWK